MAELSEIKQYHSDLVASGDFQYIDTAWMQHTDKNHTNPAYPWKIHLFASDYQDWYNLARVVIPFLIANNATFKTVSTNERIINWLFFDEVDQFGKLFTIYPDDEAEFRRLALGLDWVLSQKKLHTRYDFDNCNNIGYERQLGGTGRIFYRAERDKQGKYVDAKDAIYINSEQPYNPFNMNDPFFDMFDSKKTYGSMLDIMQEIKKISEVYNKTKDKYNKEDCKFFCPKNDANMPRLEQLFKYWGVKYDKGFSHTAGGRTVLRVFNSDMPKKPKTQSRVEEVLAKINSMAVTQCMERSADNAGSSVYYFPKPTVDVTQLETLFKQAGIKYEVHFSKLFGRNIIRVLDDDMQQQISSTGQQKTMQIIRNNMGARS